MYQFPVYHPLVVHFPVALLLLSGISSLVWLITGSPQWRLTTLFILSAGILGAIAALVTGEPMHEYSRGMPIVKALVKEHKALGYWTLYVGSAALVVLVIYSLLRKRNTGNAVAARDTLAVRLIGALLTVTAAVLVGITGHLGGTMAWGEKKSDTSMLLRPDTRTEIFAERILMRGEAMDGLSKIEQPEFRNSGEPSWKV